MKRVLSKVITTLIILSFCVISSIEVHATVQETIDKKGANTNVAVGGPITWTSGTFVLNTTTTNSTKHFDAGNITIAFSSTNEGYSGRYSVTLRKANILGYTDYATFSIPSNGNATCTWTNMPSGDYVLSFTPGDSTSNQSYTITLAQ